MRAAVRRPKIGRQKISTKQFPAPTRGWVLNENIATAGRASARVLDNWFPTATGIRVRGGSKQVARIANNQPCYSLINYQTGMVESFFAASNNAIYDITNPSDANVIPTAVVTGQTSGSYSYVQFSTVAGQFLIAVNGANSHLIFDGSAWAKNVPAITNVSSTKFSHVWSYKNRLFFVEGGTNNAWYLPVDSIGGNANVVSMNGIFKRGGSLLFGGTWSLDAGDGLDDKCVFISTMGEVAVYEGSNPSSALDWAIIGRYDITAPMGMNASMQAGGDMLVAVESGVVPISSAINKDAAALSLSAISAAIEPYWKEQVESRRSIPWEMLKWPANNMMIVSQPATSPEQTSNCLVANLETGAWCRFTGWDTRCLGLHKGRGFFGTNTGEIFQMEFGGSDNGIPYTSLYVGQFDNLDNSISTKRAIQSRASFQAASKFVPKLSFSTNYCVLPPAAPASVSNYQLSEWDAAEWDVGIWDSGEPYKFSAKWSSIGRTGYSFAPEIQITSKINPLPRVELVAIDLTYESGGIVV